MIHCTLKLCEYQEQNSSLFFPLVIVVKRLAFFPPFFCKLSFISCLFFPNYLKEMNASPVFQHDIAMRWHLA